MGITIGAASNLRPGISNNKYSFKKAIDVSGPDFSLHRGCKGAKVRFYPT